MNAGFLRESAPLHDLVRRYASPIRKTTSPAYRKGWNAFILNPHPLTLRCVSSWSFPSFSSPHPTARRSQASFKLGNSPHTTAEEEEQDKILEEEEFSAMQERAEEEDRYLPFAHRLAGKADALDMELRRLRWELLERQQLLVDTEGGTFFCRPANPRRVLVRVFSNQRASLQNDSITSKSRNSSLQGLKNHDEEMTLTAKDLQPYSGWCGSPSVVVRFVAFLARRLLGLLSTQQPPHRDGEDASTKEIATLTQDLDYIRRVRSYHALNFYSRMNLTPKRHLGHAVYIVLWNLWIGVQNGLGCLIFYTMREIKETGWIRGLLRGPLKGGWAGLKFMAYGWGVSPFIHLPCGLFNSLYGPMNFFTGNYFFDALSGRWMRCNMVDSQLHRHLLQREKRLIRAIGRLEFKRKRMRGEEKWARRLAAMGFSLDKFGQKFMSKHGRNANGKASPTARGRESESNLYEVLGVKRTATQQQIKAQYKKLAMLFHPDVIPQSNGSASERERQEAQSRFEAISNAYGVLSNLEKRRAYDIGGARAIEMQESRHGRFLARTPEAMVQSIFGGEAFRRTLLGELLRSHWALRTEAQVSVSLHQFEELLCIRVRQIALELAAIADVHAKGDGKGTGKGTNPPFERPRGGGASKGNRSKSPSPFPSSSPSSSSSNANETTSTHDARLELHPGSNAANDFSRDFDERCERFVARLAEACFGRELLYEVGEAYVVGAQRFLRLRPFYAPKKLLNRKIFSGVSRIVEAILEKKNPLGEEALARRILVEYFNMEYDNVVADAHVVLRYAVQMVLQDATQSAEVRRRRCYAVWWLGKKMMKKGSPWDAVKRDDGDLIAYVQQAANASATTSKPPEF
ncbi:unnamed protein product [Phytomonas sp. EM1]|nr:unnamed protein product [Phytomonas sp. EM1]|eukprot:CCW65145.1 unnamed protein product [Phytomonas sp. isolate EM1]